MKAVTQSNKKGWDGLVASHYKDYETDKLITGEPLLNDLVRNEVGNVSGKSLVHLLCHIGTDTLSWALLGAKVTGIDISPESLKDCTSKSYRLMMLIKLMVSKLNLSIGQLIPWSP